MIHMSKKVRLTVIAIAVWTVVQTIFHAFWVIYSYLLTICKIKPTYYDVVFVYLTYFYRKTCGDIDVKDEAYFLNSTSHQLFYSNGTVSETLYAFIKATLKLGNLPEQSNVATRTDIYLFLFLYTDVTWLVSAVFLFVGAFFERKQKIMSILFYGPWMLVCTFVSFLDVVASVHFGLDILYTHSYTSWLNFIGVSNYKDFERYDSYPSSKLIFAMPSTIIVCLLSRVFFVWLVNICCFFFIMFMAIPNIFFKNTVRPASRSRKSDGNKLKFRSGEEIDLNSSEARIRNWQLFYGAIEANSTMASSSSNSSESSNNTDHNSNSKSSEGDSKITKEQLIVAYGEKEPEKHDPSSFISANSGFRRYSDVAQGVSVLPSVSATNVKMQVLRGQLPWSYISPDGEYLKNNHMYKKNTAQKSVKIRDSVSASSQL